MNEIQRFRRSIEETHRHHNRNHLKMANLMIDIQSKAKEALRVLKQITPGNIHLKTNATYGERIDFESLWYNHTSDAARLYLLVPFMKGTLFILDELQPAQPR